jgi:hypothetical protein
MNVSTPTNATWKCRTKRQKQRAGNPRKPNGEKPTTTTRNVPGVDETVYHGHFHVEDHIEGVFVIRHHGGQPRQVEIVLPNDDLVGWLVFWLVHDDDEAVGFVRDGLFNTRTNQ